MINIKAQQTLVKFNKQDAGTLRYVMRPEKYSQLAENKVIAEAAVRSGIAKGALKGAWDAIGEVIKAWVTEGHSVAIPGLGTLRFGMNAQAVEDVNDVAKGLIRTRKVVFTPSVDIKSELKATKIAITCYDKDGNLVKCVTSTDDGEVEDPEGGDDNGGDNGGGSNGGGSNGGSQNQEEEGVMAPQINGENPFTESTEVTIQGPQGASVYYTTDGSTPTSESTLYSAAFTLTESTTIKAIAILNGESSEVSTRAFSKSSGGSGGGSFDTGS